MSEPFTGCDPAGSGGAPGGAPPASRGRRLILLALAVVAYGLAAWAVEPGFYDGIAPPQPYRWVSPPPQFQASNQPALAGRATVKVDANGLVGAASVATQDGQAALSFGAGTLATPADRSPVTVGLTPQPHFPDPGAVRLATNVYCLTSSSPLAGGKEMLVTLQFSPQLTAPTDVYEYQGDGPWRRIGNAGAAAPYFIAARATSVGCFAGGYSRTTSARASGGQAPALPIMAALAIGVVVIAGLPLVLLRLRGPADA